MLFRLTQSLVLQTLFTDHAIYVTCQHKIHIHAPNATLSMLPHDLNGDDTEVMIYILA